jgi:hypothetical protein
MASGVAVASSSATLCVGIAPSISGFDPMIGAANTSVTIFGTALGQATVVRFNGACPRASSRPTTAPVVDASGTVIDFVVPSNANTGRFQMRTASSSAISEGVRRASAGSSLARRQHAQRRGRARVRGASGWGRLRRGWQGLRRRRRYCSLSASAEGEALGASLLGVDDAIWLTTATWLAAPAFGLVCLYVLRIELKKIPFVAFDHSFTVPKSFIACLAVLFAFAFAFCSAVALSLKNATRAPHQAEFLASFFRPLSSPEKEWISEVESSLIKRGFVQITSYDGDSDLIVLVNSRRLFGTHVDCIGPHQCSSATRFAAHPSFKIDSRFANYSDPNPLGRIWAMNELRSGLNKIDIIAGNSGKGGCKGSITVGFETKGGNVIKRAIEIRDGVADSIKNYGTRSENGSYRLCDRVRLEIALKTV